MPEAPAQPAAVTDFLRRWEASWAAEQAREETQGVVRWLRPEFQNPDYVGAGSPRPGAVTAPLQQTLIEPDERPVIAAAAAKASWPKTLPEQVAAVRGALANAGGPATAEQVARTFLRARADKVEELLVTLATLGQVREIEPGMFVG